jgi:hypothetical protein
MSIYPIIIKRLTNIRMELSDGAGTLGCIATHEHAKMVAKQLQTMFHSDRCVSLLGLISRGWNKFSNFGCNGGGESASTAIIIRGVTKTCKSLKARCLSGLHCPPSTLHKVQGHGTRSLSYRLQPARPRSDHRRDPTTKK